MKKYFRYSDGLAMKTLEKNITNLFGETGKEWLNSLPITLEKLSQ